MRVSLSSWLRRAAVCGAALAVVGAGLAPVAQAAGTARVEADVQCDGTGHGVLDLTLINDGVAAALFDVVQPSSVVALHVVVAPGDAYAVTITGLADGPVTVIVAIDGVESQISAQVACALPQVQSAAPTSQSGVAAAYELPSTGWSGDGVALAGALVLAGGVITVLARRRPA